MAKTKKLVKPEITFDNPELVKLDRSVIESMARECRSHLDSAAFDCAAADECAADRLYGDKDFCCDALGDKISDLLIECDVLGDTISDLLIEHGVRCRWDKPKDKSVEEYKATFNAVCKVVCEGLHVPGLYEALIH
jgi:hypothetical protein